MRYVIPSPFEPNRPSRRCAAHLWSLPQRKIWALCGLLGVGCSNAAEPGAEGIGDPTNAGTSTVGAQGTTANTTPGPGSANPAGSETFPASTSNPPNPNGPGTTTQTPSGTSASSPAQGTAGTSETPVNVGSGSEPVSSNNETEEPSTDSGSTPSDSVSSGGGETAPPDLDPGALIAAPDGVANAPGTVLEPTTLASAVARVTPGGTIYLRGGDYALDTPIALDVDGTSGALVTLRGYPEDPTRPHLDFSAMSENSSNRGLQLSGDYWHLYGLDVSKAGDNCLFISGAHNTVEYSTFSECADTGLQLGNGAANNLILNCDSYFNADSSLENADGFAAKLDVGTGNRFVGCRAWNNLDDGWDGYLRPADGVLTTYERCWAFDNGKLADGRVGAGDGNGFKTGGSDDKNLRHDVVYTQCIAAGNVNDGFDHNSNRGKITILNSAAHANGSNLNFGSSNSAASLTIKNTISLGANGSLVADVTDITHNSWQDGRAATEADFVSVDTELLKAPRKSDGSLPDIDYLVLSPTSDLRQAGTDVGLPFEGSAPDLGPFPAGD